MKPVLTTAWGHRFDVALVLAVAAIIYGIAGIYRPAAWIVAGLALGSWAVLSDIARLRRAWRDRNR